MSPEYVFGIVISILLSGNGIMFRFFISSVKDLKIVIQELALAVRSSQKDIEFIHRELDIHNKQIEKHEMEIDRLKDTQN
ncbi:MAG: hypothetical protein PHW82_12965 [Bacteroidales bacterium]|nr:hypothetical protein [Bacteroidales bacterium]